MLEIKLVRLSPTAKVPKKAHSNDAGFDLTADSISEDEYGNIVYNTNIVVSIPPGYVGLLFPRSSISRYDLTLANCVGVIDSDYIGTIMMKMKPTLVSVSDIKSRANLYEVGDKCGQLVFLELPKVELVEVDELRPTTRGTSGFGSSGN